MVNGYFQKNLLCKNIFVDCHSERSQVRLGEVEESRRVLTLRWISQSSANVDSFEMTSEDLKEYIEYFFQHMSCLRVSF